jgi:RNase adapter protein RapZ
MAGAGKSTSARVLEDLGFFVVDNLPPPLIEPLLQLGTGAAHRERFAFVVDVRDANSLDAFPSTWDRLRAAGHRMLLVFLDCTDDVLVRRFKETRRLHPLETPTDPDVRRAITAERTLLAELRATADVVLDTQDFNVHDLKRVVTERFSDSGRAFAVVIESFGFKYGIPVELDLCFDVRFLPNPFFVEALRPLTGLDAPVAEFVSAQTDTGAFVQHALDMLLFLAPRYEREGKPYVTVAVGCTGGKHRSTAVAELLATALRGAGDVDVRVRHRDVGRE